MDDKNAQRWIDDEAASSEGQRIAWRVLVGIESVAFTHADQDAVALAAADALRSHAEMRQKGREQRVGP